MRLLTNKPATGQMTIDRFYRSMDAMLPPEQREGLSPQTLEDFLRFCIAQSCGKCSSCRIGLVRMAEHANRLAEGTAADVRQECETLGQTARCVYLTADCAIGYEPAKLVLDSVGNWETAGEKEDGR